MQKRSELFFNTILLPVDFAAILAAFIGAYALRVKIETRPVPFPLGFEHFLPIFMAVIPIWILIFALSGLYSQSGLRGRWDEIGKIFIAVSGGVMLLIVADYISARPLFPAKAIPIYGYGLSFLFVLFGRQIIRLIQRALFGYGVGIHRAVVIGSGPMAKRIADDLGSTQRSGYRVVGVIDSAKSAGKRMPGLPVYKNLEEMRSALGLDVDEFIQADSNLDQDEIIEILTYSTNHHLGYRFVPNQFGMYATNTSLGSLAGLPVVEIRQTPLEGWGRIIKRSFDIVGSTLGLIVLSPVLLIVAALVFVSDPGPVFFRHLRLSRAAEPFYIYKFRTMRIKYSGLPPEEVFGEMGRQDLIDEFAVDHKVKQDPRLTSVGSFLRKSSLDELPQLANVLLGHLSLVGPRPIVEAELSKFGASSSLILALKPGITGLWQISGRNDLSYEDRVKLNIYYVENWSLLLDIRILLKTVVILLKGRGAY